MRELYLGRKHKLYKGDMLGRLTVLSCIGTRNGRKIGEFKCSCGKIKILKFTQVLSGKTRSCGCLFKEEVASNLPKLATKHGKKHTKVYQAWRSMFNRCNNPNTECFHRYGGRGIKMIKRWFKFEEFYKDMGDPPSKEHSLDRINVNGNYNKTNCRWATKTEQSNNRRDNLYITWKDKTMTATQWSREFGMHDSTIRSRLRRGWSIERVMTEPLHKNKSYRRKL